MWGGVQLTQPARVLDSWEVIFISAVEWEVIEDKIKTVKITVKRKDSLGTCNLSISSWL